MNPKTMAYVGLVMGSIITLLSLFLIIKPDVAANDMIERNSVLIGGVGMLYGLFRVYRAYLTLRNLRNDL